MKFAVAIPNEAQSWRVVRRRRAEFLPRLVLRQQMLSPDPFVAMAAAALKTTQIRLGTGIRIPSNRLAAVAANAFASSPRNGRSSPPS
jgi:5,10-methylenetetrahydromethanopterin reductase